LHVVIVFMIQFVALLLLGGGAVPALYEQRLVATPLLVVGAIVVIGGVVAALAELARVIPVRCKYCGNRALFRGAAWWPFTYRYACAHCGHAMRYDVVS
jgi:DNA-directed RNA polymerase subunit RPC12/RpoP